MPSRQVYMLHPADPTGHNAKARWLLKRDYALIERHGYTIDGPGQIRESDVPRIEELYGKLYLEKYSRFNPDFSGEYIRLALRDGFCSCMACAKMAAWMRCSDFFAVTG